MSVLIAGAGPAGSILARKLSESGVNVILVERLDNPKKQAFSSAALPIEAIEKHQIPVECISSYWRNWQIFSPENDCYKWESSHCLGVVLDFGELRSQLWKRAIDAGVEVLMGWTVVKVESLNTHALVEISSSDGKSKLLTPTVVVDATGYKRSLLGIPRDKATNLLTGTGVEWVLKVDKKIDDRWKNNLTFYIGSSWVKNGYGWVFPMSRNRIKVGICTLPPHNNIKSNIQDLKKLIQANELDDCSIEDKHGGVIQSTIDRSERHYSGRIIGVGDSVSTSNLLGGEGIRHAISSAEILSKHLVETYQKNNFKELDDFVVLKRYQGELRRKLGWKWTISNKIGKRTWWGLSGKEGDKRISKILRGLSMKASAEDLSSVLFDYKFERFGMKLIPYLIGLR